MAQDEATTSPLAFYVWFVEEIGDWRVHMIDRPNLSVKDLDATGIELRKTRLIETPSAIHLRFSVVT